MFAGYKNVTRRHDGVYGGVDGVYGGVDGVYGGVDGCSREWGVVDESRYSCE